MKQGWEIKKLGEVFDLQMGKTPSRDNGDYWGGDNVWVAISDLQDKYIGESKEYITDKALTETKIKKVKAGTTIMSFKLSVGRAAITTQDLYTNEAIMAFNLNEGYDLIADYIYYYLKGYKWQGANKAVMGLTLNKASISQNHIAIPPREEQERIVAELDCLSGVIEKKKQQLKELDALAETIFYIMFGDPITNEKGWEVKKWEEVFDTRTGKLNANVMNENGRYPFFTCSKEIFYIDTYAFDCEALLLAGNNATANYDVKYYNGKFNAYQRTYVLTLKDNSLYKFFKFALENNLSLLQEQSIGGMTKYLTLGILHKIEFIAPPLALQQEFADKIEAIEKQKELIKESIKETETLFNARMDYYFN